MATFDELLNNIGSNPKIRAFGTFAEYQPETEHKDVIYLATDEGKIYLNGESYGDSDIPVIPIRHYTYSLDPEKVGEVWPLFDGQRPFPDHFVIEEGYLDILKKKPSRVLFTSIGPSDVWWEEADGTLQSSRNRPNPYMPKYMMGTLVDPSVMNVSGNLILSYRVEPYGYPPLQNDCKIITGSSLNGYVVSDFLSKKRSGSIIGINRYNPDKYEDTLPLPYMDYGHSGRFMLPINTTLNIYINQTYTEGETVDGAFKVFKPGIQGFIFLVTTISSGDKEYQNPYISDASGPRGLEGLSSAVRFGVDMLMLDNTLKEIILLLQQRAIHDYDRNDLGGLGLSRNNFTDAFKEALTPLLPAEEGTEPEKVLSDNNYSDEDKQVVDNAKTFLEAIDPENTTINRWKELESFLVGITDTETLTGLLEDIQNAAAADATAKANAVKAELDTLKADYDTLKAEHDQLMTDFTTLKTNFESFQTNVTTLLSDLYRIVEVDTDSAPEI